MNLKLRFQGVRDLHAAAVHLAQVLDERPELQQACLAVQIPRISRQRLQKEWKSVKSVLRPNIASRLVLISVGGERPWADPAEPGLEKLAARLHAQVRGPEQRIPAARPAITAKFFEIFKILLNRRLRRRGALRIGEIIGQSGSSYPTVAEVVDHLIETRELVRRASRSVELVDFPRQTWSEILALSRSLRKPICFADASGRSPDLLPLLRRIGAKAPSGLAVGGVLAARHWDARFDLHGLPRLHLSIHAPQRVFDTGVIERADPALRIVGSKSDRIVLALHPLLRKETLFEASSRGPLPVVDPVETLLDLHELGLQAQAEELIERLAERKHP
ncbi:MAG: hypothetical protein DMF60_09525 [Acidobacteria bacterium]|nr:MAG: hypothetical protein DMF60_09525 [Acidobacteriota bacterium]